MQVVAVVGVILEWAQVAQVEVEMVALMTAVAELLILAAAAVVVQMVVQMVVRVL